MCLPTLTPKSTTKAGIFQLMNPQKTQDSIFNSKPEYVGFLIVFIFHKEDVERSLLRYNFRLCFV